MTWGFDARAPMLAGALCIASVMGRPARAESNGLEGGDAAQRAPRHGEQRRETARELGQQAIELMKKKRWTRAQRLLERAYALYPAPSLAVLEGDTLLELGKLEQAKSRFERAASTAVSEDTSAAFRRARRMAHHRLKDLEASIPRLVVNVPASQPPEGVWINGAALPRELFGLEQRMNPGVYVVRARWNDARDEQRVKLGRGDEAEVALRPHRAARESEAKAPRDHGLQDAAAYRRRIIAGWSSIGLGGAGLITGIAAGLVTQNREDALKQRCDATCPPSAADDIRALERSRAASFAGYGVGLAGLALGGVLLLTAHEPQPESDRSIEPYVTLRTVGIQGTF